MKARQTYPRGRRNLPTAGKDFELQPAKMALPSEPWHTEDALIVRQFPGSYRFLENAVFRAVISLVLFFHSSVWGQNYTVSGTIHSKTYFGNMPEETADFKITVNDCQWFLHENPQELKMRGEVQKKNFSYVEASFDGTQYYVVNSFVPPPESNSQLSQLNIDHDKQMSPQRPDANNQNVAVGMIGAGIIPEDAGSHVRELWLGLASRCYFDSITNDWLYPLFMKRSDSLSVGGPFAVKALMNFLPDNKHIPMHLVYTYAFKGKSEIAGHDSAVTTSNAVFEIISYTNIQSVIIPTYYSVKNYSMSGKLLCETYVSGEMVEPYAKRTDFVLALPGKTYVTDLRFPPIGQYDNASYMVEKWPPPEKVATVYKTQLNASAMQQRRASAMSNRNRWDPKARLVAFIIMSGGVALALYFFRTVARKQTNEKMKQNENI